MSLNKYLNIIEYLVINMQRLVSIPKTDLESMEATIETLQNKEVMEQLEKSEEDIRKGRVRNIDEFIKELEGQ
jgi:PHD/YefM family antitoxin component YafN of YafNO toxin-antitoxin module